MIRFYAEGPCVHGEIREHRTGPFKAGGKTSWGTCSGVTRRELTIDYEAAAHVLREKLSTNGFKMKPAKVRAGHWISEIIHAALSEGNK